MKGFLNNIFVAFVVAVFIFIFNSLPSKSSTVRFAQLSDVHYSTTRLDTTYKLLSHSKELLLDAVNQINCLENLNFVMVTGDLIDQPIVDSAKETISILNRLKYPWYYAVGNHDTASGNHLTKQELIEMLAQDNPCYKYDKLYYSFTPKKGFKVIVLDGASDVGYISNGKISGEELKWLDSQLNESKHDVVLLFIHFPLLEPFPASHHRILNADEFNCVLAKYKNPIAIFAGHYHTTKIVKKGNILHVASPALVSYPNAFRLVTVTNSKDKAVFNFEFKETGLKNIQTKAKLMTLGSSSYYGEESDRTTTVVIDK